MPGFVVLFSRFVRSGELRRVGGNGPPLSPPRIVPRPVVQIIAPRTDSERQKMPPAFAVLTADLLLTIMNSLLTIFGPVGLPTRLALLF